VGEVGAPGHPRFVSGWVVHRPGHRGRPGPRCRDVRDPDGSRFPARNSNNSVRVTDEFLTVVEADAGGDLFWRTKPGRIAGTVKACELWEKIGYAAWACADPGLQFHTRRRERQRSGKGADDSGGRGRKETFRKISGRFLARQPTKWRASAARVPSHFVMI
jgi:hypothetical protein